MFFLSTTVQVRRWSNKEVYSKQEIAAQHFTADEDKFAG